MCFSSSSNGKTEPPDYVKNRMPGYLDSVDALASQQAPLYAGVRTAPLNPWQQTAGEMATDRALYGDPETNSARGFLTNITNGGANNPYLDPGYTDQIISNNARDMADSFARGTAANTNAAAARSGAYGGSAHNELAAVQGGELAKNVGDMAMRSRLARIDQSAGLYNQDRSAGMQAAGMAPAFSMLDSQSIDQMNAYGGQQQGYVQNLLDEGYNTWQGEQQYPFKMADWLGGKYSQASGGYGESMGGQSQNPFGRLLSGLLGL